MPPPVDPVRLLALLTRVRAQRVAAGELAPERLHDVRAFKSCYAELGYLRRLAAGGRAGGTVVTSMRQLVAGLAALHPAWRIDAGDGWDDRDRHRRTVRRRLDDLQAMGLLRWRIGTDFDGDERRTELELRPAPEVSAEEAQAAGGRLERWQARYGKALNTGSRTGIRNAAGHGRPPSASERQRRGIRHARGAAASRRRREGDLSNSHPPSGTLATPEKTTVDENASELRKAFDRTGARARNTRTSATQTKHEAQTAVNHGRGGRTATAESNAVAGDGQEWDPKAIVARVQVRQAERQPVLDVIARQASARAVETASWDVDRVWPAWRLREAWVVARHGAMAAADSGPAGAGMLDVDDQARLRRAAARYERHAADAPEGYPAGGLAALLHVGWLARAGQLCDGPRTIGYAIGALDQLSRRMRALGTAESPGRYEAHCRRAGRRRMPPDRPLQLAFRMSAWPPWIKTDEHGEPVFDERGLLQLDHEARCGIPDPASASYRMTVLDAYVLAGREPPVDVDGRKQMALRHRGELDRADRPLHADSEELELHELAHRTGEPITQLRRLPPTDREALLTELRQRDAARARADSLAFRQHVAHLYPRAR